MNNQQPPPFLNSQQQYPSSSTPSGGYASVPHPLDPLSSQRMTTSFSSSPLPPLPQGNNAHQHQQHFINHQHYQSFSQPSPTLSSGSGSGMNTSGYLSTTGGMPHSHSSSSIASATSSVGAGQPSDYMMRSGTVFTAGPGIGSAISISQQHEAIRAFLKGNDFPIRTPKKLQDIKGSSLEECAELAKSESWKEFLKICEKQVKPPASHRPHDLLQWRLSQLVTLLRLNQTEYAQMCVDDMGDLENNSTYFYEKYPNIYSVNQQNKAGNMMPFTILIIKAILPLLQYLKNPNAQQQQQQQQQSQNPNLPPLPVSDGSAIAMERLYALLKICSDQIKDGGFLYTKRCKLHAKMTILYTPFEGTQEEWKLREQRIVFYIITCHIARKEYYLAIQILEKLLKHYSSLIESDFGTYQRLESLLGCLYLQQGLLKPARDHFVNVEKRETNPERSTLVRANSGYLKFAYGHFVDACKEFTFILTDLDPLSVNAANNRAICMLYMCELGKAIDGVEEFVRKDPAVTLEQNLVYNLCTLYDLESTESSEKKMIISSLAHRFKGDDFGNWIIQ